MAATYDWVFEIRDLIKERTAAIEAKDTVLCLSNTPTHNSILRTLPLADFPKIKVRTRPCSHTPCYLKRVCGHQDGQTALHAASRSGSVRAIKVPDLLLPVRLTYKQEAKPRTAGAGERGGRGLGVAG
jgi:hypothetical protein